MIASTMQSALFQFCATTECVHRWTQSLKMSMLSFRCLDHGESRQSKATHPHIAKEPSANIGSRHRPDKPSAHRGDQVRIQAWILKRLISIFGRSARRGHVPRELAMKKIYEAAGIPLPESVSHAYMCRTNLTDHVRLCCMFNTNPRTR